MDGDTLAGWLRQAASPLQEPPGGVGWNLHELDGLLPVGEPRPAAVLVGVMAHQVPTVLLTRRHDGLRNHAGQVSFPGGRIEPGDDESRCGGAAGSS